MNEKVKQAQETLLKLSSLALEYLVSNFHFSNKEYPKLKKEIGNLTDKLRLTLNDFGKYYESQQDLVKGKDEYIAKLCNDRAELKEQLKQVEDYKIQNEIFKEHEKELIAEQHRLFDLAKEQEKELALLWKPIKDYFDGEHDWVLVQFKEKDTDFMPIPVVAEYRKHKKKWFPHEEDNGFINYLNDVCEPIAFMQIPHYKKVTVRDKTARLVLNKKELYHLQNDVIGQIYDIKKSVFGDEYDMGCKLSDKEKSLLTKEKEELLKSYGYYSRLELKEKLDKFENDNFLEDQCCGG